MRIVIFIIALCPVVFSGCKDRRQAENGDKQTQEALLSARLSYLQNRYDEIASFIALYQALGGGKK